MAPGRFLRDLSVGTKLWTAFFSHSLIVACKMRTHASRNSCMSKKRESTPGRSRRTPADPGVTAEADGQCETEARLAKRGSTTTCSMVRDPGGGNAIVMASSTITGSMAIDQTGEADHDMCT